MSSTTGLQGYRATGLVAVETGTRRPGGRMFRREDPRGPGVSIETCAMLSKWSSREAQTDTSLCKCKSQPQKKQQIRIQVQTRCAFRVVDL